MKTVTPPEPEELMTPREVAALFRVSTKTVARWLSLGVFQHSMRTLGGHRRYQRTEVEELYRGAQEGDLDLDLSGESRS